MSRTELELHCSVWEVVSLSVQLSLESRVFPARVSPESSGTLGLESVPGGLQFSNGPPQRPPQSPEAKSHPTVRTQTLRLLSDRKQKENLPVPVEELEMCRWSEIIFWELLQSTLRDSLACCKISVLCDTSREDGQTGCLWAGGQSTVPLRLSARKSIKFPDENA